MRRLLYAFVISLLACSNANDGTTDGSSAATDSGSGVDAGTVDAGTVDAGTDAGTTTVSISISSFTFIPLHVTVAAGGSIAVHNADPFAHTVTSQATVDAFTPGAVAGISFDTGNIAGSGDATITIPANAAHGTVIPFYCKVHGSMMGSGSVTIQ
jgi:plastocyanin